MNRLVVCMSVFSVFLGACDSTADFTGITTTAPAAPGPGQGVPDQALAGAWSGIDNSGNFIVVFSTNDGRFNLLVADNAEQGFGTASVVGGALTINYTQVAPFGFTLSDGSSSAACSGSGTIQERQTLSISVDCTTGGGLSFNTFADLLYDPLNDRDSALSVIGGVYTDEDAVVTSIAGDGVLFSQDPVSGCVQNGQVNVIDPDYNLYDVTITYSNCLAPFTGLNGATFSGFALLNNDSAPELIGFVLTGRVNSVTVALDYVLART